MEGGVSILEGGILDTIINFLNNMKVFGDLSSDEVQTLLKHMNFFKIDQGEILFREGDTGSYVCFVVEGEIDIIKESVSGYNVVIATLSKGRSIGEMSIIDNTPRSATVLVRKKATLATLSKKDFDMILKDKPVIGIKVLKGIAKLLSDNLRKTSSRLADYMLPLN